MCYMCAVEHYSAIRKDEILPFDTTWMTLENITQSEITQRENVKDYMIFYSYVGYKIESNK